MKMLLGAAAVFAAMLALSAIASAMPNATPVKPRCVHNVTTTCNTECWTNALGQRECVTRCQ